MPNLLSLSIRSIKNKIRNNNLKLPLRVNGYVISTGGCGTVTLKNFLENYTILLFLINSMIDFFFKISLFSFLRFFLFLFRFLMKLKKNIYNYLFYIT